MLTVLFLIFGEKNRIVPKEVKSKIELILHIILTLENVGWHLELVCT